MSSVCSPHLFVGLDVGLDAGLDVEPDGGDDDETAGDDDTDDDRTIETTTMASSTPKVSARTLLNTYCGCPNWTLYCWCDSSRTRTEHCCYGNSSHFLLDSLIQLIQLNLKKIAK